MITVVPSYSLKLEQFTFFKCFCVVGVARIRDFEADAVRGKSCAAPPVGQNLGMAGGRGLSPDWSSAVKSHPPTPEDRAMLHPQVSCLLDTSPLLGICIVNISPHCGACHSLC